MNFDDWYEKELEDREELYDPSEIAMMAWKARGEVDAQYIEKVLMPNHQLAKAIREVDDG